MDPLFLRIKFNRLRFAFLIAGPLLLSSLSFSFSFSSFSSFPSSSFSHSHSRKPRLYLAGIHPLCLVGSPLVRSLSYLFHLLLLSSASLPLLPPPPLSIYFSLFGAVDRVTSNVNQSVGIVASFLRQWFSVSL